MGTMRPIVKAHGTQDDNAILITASTVIAIDTNCTTLDLGANYTTIAAPQVVMSITAIDSADGDEGYNFTLHQSDDNFATDDVTIGTTTIQSAGAGDLDIILTSQQVWGTDAIVKRYVRIVVDVSGTSPSVTLGAYLL